MKNVAYSAAVIGANLARLEDDLASLEQARCDELHFHILDGHFGPGFAFGPATIAAAKACCNLKCHAHLMVQRPQRHVQEFVEVGCNVITVHIEAALHAHRLLEQIRSLGVSPGIAINPGTPLTKLTYVLDLVDRVTVLANEPGLWEQPFIESTVERVRILSENIAYNKQHGTVAVDGNLTIETAAACAHHGAEIVVLRDALFKNGDPGVALAQIRTDLPHYEHLV